MSAGLLEHQKAVYVRLTGASAPIPSGRIYDDKPEGDDLDYPYVEIGEVTAESDDLDTSDGTESILDLHVWSRHAGKKEVLEIADAIKAEFHKTALVVTGRNALVWWGGFFTAQGGDGKTWHGIIRLKIISRT